MPVLIDLPGGPKVVAVEIFKTPKQALRIIRKGIAATADGPNGCINLWVNDAGRTSGHLMRFNRIVHSGQFEGSASIEACLKIWLLEIKRPNARTAAILRALGLREAQ